MITSTKKVFALAALIVATGVAAVELGRDTAQAEPVNIMTRDAAYAAARVDTAFDLVAALPATPAVMIPMAHEGRPSGPAGLPWGSGRRAGRVHGRRLRASG